MDWLDKEGSGLINEITKKVPRELFKKEYTYDNYGNLTKERVGTIPITSDEDLIDEEKSHLQIEEELYKIEYTYDENHNNCIKKVITEGQNSQTIHYQYDLYGNLIEEEIQGDKIEYLYSTYFKELVEVKQGQIKNILTYKDNLLTKVSNTYGMGYKYNYNQREELNKINYQTQTTTYPLEEYITIKAAPNNVFNITKGQIGTFIEYNNVNRVGYAYDKYGNLIKQYEYRLASDQMEVTSTYIYAEEKLSDGTSIYEIENLNDERII